MKHEDLIAIDIHTHAEVSCRNPFDNYGEEYDRAADKYFGSNRRPTIAETVAYYRERKVGLVMFTVDSESNMGRRRIPNEEIADAARENSDMMIAFASIDPHKGKMGAREAERLIKEAGVKGFKFHPTVQGFHPYDRMAWPIYEVINHYKLPVIFHTGHSGIGSGMRCGGGLRLEYSNPMHLDDVAIAFGDMQIVMAHPSFPWQGRSVIGGHAQAQRLDRPVRLESEVFPRPTGAVLQHAPEGQGAVRQRLPPDHPRSLDEGRRDCRLQAGGDARNPEGQCGAPARPGLTDGASLVIQAGTYRCQDWAAWSASKLL
jgi:hypothetical protein